MSVNTVILIGNLGKDPEVRSFQNGGRVCNFSLATSERWKDKSSGEQKERTDWHAIAIMNDGLVGVAERYLRKGSKVYLRGQLQTRKWQDQSGNDRWTTEVVLRGFDAQLVMLDSKEGRADSREDYSNAGMGGEREPGGGPGADEYEDSIPFGPEWRV